MRAHLFIFLSLVVLSACRTRPYQESAQIPKYEGTHLDSGEAPGCKSLLDNYCNRLYSPDASGNLILDRLKPIQILQGETSNQLPQVFMRYSEAKLKNRHKLPRDFYDKLNFYDYFSKLEAFIHRNPIPKMSLEERLQSEHLDHELGSIWQSAMDQTILARMNKKFPGYYRIPDRAMPPEYEVEQRRMHRNLISEISKVLWQEDANWAKVETSFRELKDSFHRMIAHVDIPVEVRKDWDRKIDRVHLVLPGSLPEISDEECSTTTINAYYYKYLDMITVCAGDFNSEDIVLTLAHEMAHALGIDRDLYSYLIDSPFGKKLRSLRENVCHPEKAMDCDDWAQFKAEVEPRLADLGRYRPQLPEFNRCLKRASTTKMPSSEDTQRIAEEITNDRISSMASSDFFLRLIKENVPMRNGTMKKNPNYMNPCGYYLWSRKEEPIDSDLYSLVFFTAEYKCSKQSEKEKLKQAIDVARSLTVQVVRAVLDREGEFSERPQLTAQGIASSPSERFADVVGTYAVAEYLQRFNSSWEKRSKYLASASWMCREPSLESKYPEEAKIENLFNLESHSEGLDRKMELLSEPVRDVLQCHKDFSFNECHLGFREASAEPQLLDIPMKP